MNAGYVRLSRDDDKRNYVSIENQKLIINQFAAEQNLVIDRWYEDDGVSGYIFDRPGFNQLMVDLYQDIDTVFVKDFSRLGRHNAKVLLLLDEFQEQGKRLIVIDDNYDSSDSEDDTIGIKTWYNERYIKDTSKKIRRAIGARQKAGTLMTQPPFGYRRNKEDKSKIEIVQKEAEYVKQIFDLYLQGYGYRKIANYLTEKCVPTPSMVRHERELGEGKVTKRQIAVEWSDSMVKDMLCNDFYIGTLRLRKRTRYTVHGKDQRVRKDEQYVFENNHPAIIDKVSFDLIQSLKKKRIKSNYRGSHGNLTGPEVINPFGSCLFCKDCGSRLTPIRRAVSGGMRKYYICTTYNTKGKRHCPKAHLIEEADLMEDVVIYLKLCRDIFCEIIAAYDMKEDNAEKKSVEEKRVEIQNSIDGYKSRLKILFAQKVKDLANACGNEDIINESYDALQKDILAQIHGLKMNLQELDDIRLETKSGKEKLQNALSVIDDIIEKGILGRKDIELLIERIEIDKDGFPEIELKYGLSDHIQHSPAQKMNRFENEIIFLVMRLIFEDGRGFTSAKYLSQKLTDIGYPKSRTKVLPYIGLMIDMCIIEPGEKTSKPYIIIKSKNEIREVMADFYRSLLSDNDNDAAYVYNLHEWGAVRRYASDGFRVHSENKRH